MGISLSAFCQPTMKIALPAHHQIQKLNQQVTNQVKKNVLDHVAVAIEKTKSSQYKETCVACGLQGIFGGASICGQCRATDRAWGVSDTLEVLRFLSSIGVTGLSLSTILFSASAGEATAAYAYAANKSNGPQSKYASRRVVSHIMDACLGDEAAKTLLSNLDLWSIDQITLFLKRQGNKRTLQNAVCLLGLLSWLIMSKKSVSDRTKVACQILDRMRAAAKRPFFVQVSRSRDLQLQAELLPISFGEVKQKCIGSVNLDYFVEQGNFGRLITRVCMNPLLPKVLNKLVLCHELVHASLWLRQPYRDTGYKEIEEIACHVVMTKFADQLLNDPTQYRSLTTHEKKLIQQRWNWCKQDSEHIRKGMLERWAKMLAQYKFDVFAQHALRVIDPQ